MRIIIIMFLSLSVVALALAYHNKPSGYFASVPVEEVHTMILFEDGSYVIEYQDNTSETGCVPGGLCE